MPSDTAISTRKTTGKARDAFRTISEVAEELDLPQHVLRFWESKFAQVKPLKRSGNRRYYRPEDIDLLKTIKGLLYDDGYTIKGVQKLFRDHGARSVVQAYLPNGSLSELLAPAVDGQATTPRADADPKSQRQRDDQLDAVLEELRAIRRLLTDG